MSSPPAVLLANPAPLKSCRFDRQTSIVFETSIAIDTSIRLCVVFVENCRVGCFQGGSRRLSLGLHYFDLGSKLGYPTTVDQHLERDPIADDEILETGEGPGWSIVGHHSAQQEWGPHDI